MHILLYLLIGTRSRKGLLLYTIVDFRVDLTIILFLDYFSPAIPMNSDILKLWNRLRVSTLVCQWRERCVFLFWIHKQVLPRDILGFSTLTDTDSQVRTYQSNFHVSSGQGNNFSSIKWNLLAVSTRFLSFFYIVFHIFVKVWEKLVQVKLCIIKKLTNKVRLFSLDIVSKSVCIIFFW